jgi:hypothetical protein
MRPALVLALLLAASATSEAQARARSAARRQTVGIAIGEITWSVNDLERAQPPDKTKWRRVAGGDKLRTGDTLRSGAESLTRIELPWMTVTLGSASMLTIPPSAVLSTVLDQGRAEFSGPGRDIVKIQVGEGEVRGGGRLVLRRSLGRTGVSVRDGSFRVRALGRQVEVKAGQGTIVFDGRPPEAPFPLPAAPKRPRPGSEVAYVRSGQPVELSWAGSGRAHQVELLALQTDDVLLAREAGASPFQLEIPWLGTFRWRVSARDERGVESAPSPAGFVCSVAR